MTKLIPALLITTVVGCVAPEDNVTRPLRGPHGTFAHIVGVSTSEPGSKIEVNQEYVGDSPLAITVYGDRDGTFRRGMNYIIKAYPVKPGQHSQVKIFTGPTGPLVADRIPKRIFFDLNLVPVGDKSTQDITVRHQNEPSKSK